MTLEKLQERINALPAALAAKGKRCPDASFSLYSNSGSWVSLSWSRPTNDFSEGYKHFRFDDVTGLDAALDAAEAWIAALPTIENANLQEFMTALGAVIEKGKTLNIDVDYVNPLIATMKRLSKNALTDQRAA